MIETLPSKVQFESFLVDSAEAPDPTEEALALELTEKLDLAGQRSLQQRTGTAIVPFREMTNEELIVYSLLCPQRSGLREFDMDPIPLRALELIDRALALGTSPIDGPSVPFFKRIQIWHPKRIQDDPLVVGCTGASDYERNRLYLIARWGACLLEWPDLVKAACTAQVARLTKPLEELTVAINSARAGTLPDELKSHLFY